MNVSVGKKLRKREREPRLITAVSSSRTRTETRVCGYMYTHLQVESAETLMGIALSESIKMRNIRDFNGWLLIKASRQVAFYSFRARAFALNNFSLGYIFSGKICVEIFNTMWVNKFNPLSVALFS